jgi:Uncharacterised nucleotidyltransferase
MAAEVWSEHERRLCRVLVGAPLPAPAGPRQAVLDAAVRHRLDVVLAWQVRVRAASDRADEFLGRLGGTIREAAVLEEVRRAELTRVLAALADGRLPAVLFKGGALAYAAYPAPYLRPRLDHDLLVRESDVPAVRACLEKAGYEPAVETSGALITAQCHYTRFDRAGVRHALDIHWRPFNAPRFTDLLTFDEVKGSARPLTALAPDAVAPSPVHHLLIACVHRIAHHADSPDLLWLYDIHLLASAMDGRDLMALVDLASRKRVLSACLRGIRLARACYATPLPDAVCERFAEEPALAKEEGLSVYLDGTRPLALQAVTDMRALGGWRARGRLLREHLLPPPAYMRARYGTRGWLALPFLYVYRVCRGAPGWLRF